MRACASSLARGASRAPRRGRATGAHIGRYGLIVSGLVAGLLAAGCGTVPAPDSAQPGSAAVHDVKAGLTLAGNRELARQQAAWLLSRVRVPDGATALESPPASLSSPAIGTPSDATVVDSVRSWRIDMPFAQLTAWLQQHRPSGLPSGPVPDGAVSTTDNGRLTEVGYAYPGLSSPAWQSAELGIGVAPDGNTASVMRADGQVVYLDPRPVPDSVKGPRLRVTIAGGCPRNDTGIVGVRNSGPGLRQRLLPAGSPTAGLVCRYASYGGPQWLLRAATRLNAAAAARLARSIARLPVSHTDGGSYRCPLGGDSAEVIALAYPRRSDVDLWVPSYGCPPRAANGFITAVDPG